MVYVLTMAVGFVFGAADQYLGGLWSLTHLGHWTVSISLMSAPWLALPFLFGCAQTLPRRAALLGWLVTQSALIGYFVLTLSPVEGVSIQSVDTLGFVRSQLHVILPGLVTGPVLGWLGQQWRTRRSWLSAAVVAGAFCFEPVARAAAGQLLPAAEVGTAEVVVGVATAAYFAVAGLIYRRHARPAT